MTLDAGGTDSGGLPGVIPDGPAPSIPSKAPASSGGSAAPPASTATPPLEGEAGAIPQGTETQPIGNEPTGDETESQDAQPLTLAGKTYKNHAEAENYIKAQDGRVKALTGRIGEYASSANAWMEYAKAREADVTRLRSGAPAGAPGNVQTPAAEPTAKAPTDPNGWLDGLDWGFYAQLSKDQGAEYAGYWLAKQIANRSEQMLNERLDERFKPIEERGQVEQIVQQTHGLFSTVAARLDESGAPIYPELASEDPAVGKAVVDIWATLPREVQLSERGVVLAIAEYRLQNGGPPRPAAGTASGASGQVLDSIQTAQATGAQTLTGTGTPRPAATGRGAVEADFKRQIREAGVPKVGDGDTRLGFYD